MSSLAAQCLPLNREVEFHQIHHSQYFIETEFWFAKVPKERIVSRYLFHFQCTQIARKT